MCQNWKTEIALKLKNSICDKTQKIKLWQNWKPQITTTLKKNISCDNTWKFELLKTWKLKLWLHLKANFFATFKDLNCDQTQTLTTQKNYLSPEKVHF